jgi:protocatechuate 3,4-dioxygenase beta subunit
MNKPLALGVIAAIFFVVVSGGNVLGFHAAAQQPAPSPLPAPSPSASPSATARFQITGTLVDQLNNQPLARARVAIAPVTDRATLTTVITADDGRFAFRRLAPGKYTLTAQKRGYLTRSFNQHEQFSSSIAVGPGLESNDLLFRLPPEATLSGVITDEQGDPARQAQVLVFRIGDTAGREGVHLNSRTQTDDEGAYHVAHLSPGKYMVAVSASPWYAQRPGSGGGSDRFGGNRGAGSTAPTEADDRTNALDVAYPITFYPGATDPAAAGQISLTYGDRAVASINLQPVRALHFRTKAEGSEERSYATLEVKIFDDSIPLPAVSQRATDGMLEVSGVPPGRYTLKTNDFSNGPPQTASVREIEVSANGELQRPASSRVPVNVVFEFEAGATAQPQGGVTLYNKKTLETFAERINSKGEAEFKAGVPPGNYEVSLSNAGGTYLKTIVSPTLKPLGRTVEIKGPGAQKLTLVVGNGEGKVNGVALKDDKPLAGVMVLLVPADPTHNSVLFRRDQTDSDGTFSLVNIVPGRYTALALENGWDLAWNKPAVLKPFLPQGQVLDI